MLHPPAYEDGTDSVPKRRLLELRRRGITQKKTHYMLKTLFGRSCKWVVRCDFSVLLFGPREHDELVTKFHDTLHVSADATKHPFKAALPLRSSKVGRNTQIPSSSASSQ